MKHQNKLNSLKFVAFLILILSNSIASAATITVDRDDDLSVAGDGGCSLRDAINSANINFALEDCVAGDELTTDFIIINVAGPIQLTSQIDIIGSTSIAPAVTIPRVTIKAAANNQIFLVNPFQDYDDDFHMERMRLINGDAGAGNGGALNFSGYSFTNSNPIITLSDIEFENNTATLGGALYAEHVRAVEFRITGSKFLNNSASSSFGAIALINTTQDTGSAVFEFSENIVELNTSSAEATGAMAIYSDNASNTHSVNSNQFVNNFGGYGAALALGPYGTTSAGTFNLKNNVFLYNHAVYKGGALLVNKTTAKITNNTFAYNLAEVKGGAVFISNDVTFEMVSSTMVHNQSIVSANIRAEAATSVFIGNSILAYPIGASNCSSTLVSINSSGGNIVDDGSCNFNNTNDVIATPLLSGLIPHSSGLSGFIPTPGSPAIDNVPNPDCLDFYGNIIDFDQQGTIRTIDGDGDGIAYCDSGAIEAPAPDFIWADGFESP